MNRMTDVGGHGPPLQARSPKGEFYWPFLIIVTGMAVVAMGAATRSIGWGIAEAEVNM
jgi:hypothetical protein